MMKRCPIILIDRSFNAGFVGFRGLQPNLQGVIPLLDLKTKEFNEISPYLYPGIKAQFRGKWLQLFGGVGVSSDIVPDFLKPISPNSLSLQSSVEASSPRIIQATPVAFAGTFAIASVTTGPGSAKVFSAGFGRGGSAGLSESAINKIDTGISLKEGISIPVYFFPA